MERIEYKTVINATAKKVWDTMLNLETYEQWVAKSWPGSSYKGSWKEGEQIRFIGPDGSGTLAHLEIVKPYERLRARHIAILNPGGVEDRTSDSAQGWIGIIEEYRYAEQNGKTNLTVIIETNPQWRKMFDDGWPTALEELKNLCEGKLVTSN